MRSWRKARLNCAQPIFCSCLLEVLPLKDVSFLEVFLAVFHMQPFIVITTQLGQLCFSELCNVCDVDSGRDYVLWSHGPIECVAFTHL